VTTLFISDLHLQPGRQEITRHFLQFLAKEASGAESLYVLGDLFEIWIGDDVDTSLAREVGTALRSLSDNGTPVYFMHGNRDFLLGDVYAEMSGMTLLPQPLKLDLYGVSTLLMHGDSLCIDDIEYQQFRTMVRNPAWQEHFLKLPLDQRQTMAAQARDASDTHTASAAMEIMDVNQQAVEDVMAQYDVSRLIHGHTHRPAIHRLSLSRGSAERIVLGDWYQQGSVLRIDRDQCDLAQLRL